MRRATTCARKGEAEKLIREQSAALDWTIFQPSVMFGPGDSFLNRFAGLLAAIPSSFPLARPNARFQPVLVDDVVDALVRCLHGGAMQPSDLRARRPADLHLAGNRCLGGETTRKRRWIMGLPNFAGAAGFRHELRAGPAVLQRQLPLADSRQRGAATMASRSSASSRTPWRLRRCRSSDPFEDNARLSHNRAAGRTRQSSPYGRTV